MTVFGFSDLAFVAVAGVPLSGGTDDPDAAAYIAAVETADGQALETATRVAIHSFVKGCKADGIWPAIKASCILAGARTLSGALVPLVGAAPTNFNFVGGDYNRKTGLRGNGSTKYLNSNRNNNADPQNNKHLAAYNTVAGSGTRSYVAGNTDSWVARDNSNFFARANQTSSLVVPTSNSIVGLIGVSRTGGLALTSRINSNNNTSSIASVAPASENLHIFNKGDLTQYADDRLAFYSIGESLNLALLDTRVTALINAFAAAIP